MAVCPAFAETQVIFWLRCSLLIHKKRKSIPINQILDGVGLSRAQLEKREGVMT